MTDGQHLQALGEHESTHVVGLLLALLGTTTQAKHKMKGGLLLDVVVAECAAVLELLAGEDQALLVGGDTKARRCEETNRGNNNANDRLTPPCPGSWP